MAVFQQCIYRGLWRRWRQRQKRKDKRQQSQVVATELVGGLEESIFYDQH